MVDIQSQCCSELLAYDLKIENIENPCHVSGPCQPLTSSPGMNVWYMNVKQAVGDRARSSADFYGIRKRVVQMLVRSPQGR